MVTLNDCKLGDKLKMRNGELAIYVGRSPRCASHFLVCNSVKFGYAMLYANDDGIMANFENSDNDIIGKWTEK